MATDRPQPEHGERQPPEQQADEKAGAEPPRARQAQRADGTHQRPDAEGGVEVPDARVAHVEQLDRHDDEEDEHQARHERLGREQPHQHPQLLVLEDDAEARHALAEDRRRLDLLRRLGSRDVHPENDERRDPEHRRRDCEDDVDPGHGEQETGDGRTEEEREALHGAGHGVRGGQLARRRSQRRHDRRLCGLVRGVGDRCDDRERVDELCRSVLPDAHCGSRTETEAEQSRSEEHDLAPVPVPEHADERREQARRDEAEQEDDADGFLATLVVGVDRDGHQQAPVADGNRRPRALEPAQVCAAKDGRERTS